LVTTQLPPGALVWWSIPSERVRVGPLAADPGGSAHPAVVIDVVDLGTTVEVTVRLEGGPELTSRSADAVTAMPGDRCLVGLDREAVMVWPMAEEDGLSSSGPPTVIRSPS
jgi:hypothetical protein